MEKTIKIYMIRSKNAEHPERYIGSTTKPAISYRMSVHKAHYKNYKDGDTSHGWCKSYDIFEKYGVENCEIVLITEVPFINNEQKRTLERYWLERTPNCVNQMRPIVSQEETKKDKADREKTPKAKEQRKQYAKEHQEERKVYHHEWRHAQGKTECPCGGHYTTTRQKEHEETSLHKAWLAGTPVVPKGIPCACGSRYTLKNKKEHEKTKRHLQFLEKSKDTIVE